MYSLVQEYILSLMKRFSMRKVSMETSKFSVAALIGRACGAEIEKNLTCKINK